MCFQLLVWGGAHVPTLSSSPLHSSPTAAANERELDEESFTGIKAGDRKAGLQEELIGYPESKEVELVLLGDMELLFLAEGPYEDRPLSPSISAGWQHLSPSTVLLTVPFAEKVGEGRAGCRRC